LVFTQRKLVTLTEYFSAVGVKATSSAAVNSKDFKTFFNKNKNKTYAELKQVVSLSQLLPEDFKLTGGLDAGELGRRLGALTAQSADITKKWKAKDPQYTSLLNTSWKTVQTITSIGTTVEALSGKIKQVDAEEFLQDQALQLEMSKEANAILAALQTSNLDAVKENAQTLTELLKKPFNLIRRKHVLHAFNSRLLTFEDQDVIIIKN